MSQLILPGRQQPIALEFDITVLPDGNMVLTAKIGGAIFQFPPMSAESLSGIAGNLTSAANQVIAKKRELQVAHEGTIQVG